MQNMLLFCLNDTICLLNWAFQTFSSVQLYTHLKSHSSPLQTPFVLTLAQRLRVRIITAKLHRVPTRSEASHSHPSLTRPLAHKAPISEVVWLWQECSSAVGERERERAKGRCSAVQEMAWQRARQLQPLSPFRFHSTKGLTGQARGGHCPVMAVIIRAGFAGQWDVGMKLLGWRVMRFPAFGWQGYWWYLRASHRH